MSRVPRFSTRFVRLDPVLVLALAVGVALRIYTANFHRQWGFTASTLQYVDERNYLELARDVATSGARFFISDERALWTSPVPLVVLAALGNSIELGKWFGLAASLATIVVAYRLGFVATNTRGAARVSALLVATSLGLSDYAVTLLTEPIFTLLFVSALTEFVCLGRGLDGGSLAGGPRSWRLHAILGGVLLGVASCTRPIPSLLAPVLAAAAAVNGVVRRKGAFSPIFRRCAVASVIAMSVTGVVVIKNAIAFSRPSVANGFGAALYLGARQDTEGDEPPWHGKDYGTDLVCPGVHVSTPCDDALAKRGRELIAEAPWGFVKLMPLKVGRLLVGNAHAYFHPDLGIVSAARWRGPDDLTWRTAALVHAAFLACFGIAGLLFPSRLSEWGRIVLLTAVAYVAFIGSLTFSIPRYGLPVAPLLAVAAAAQIAGRRTSGEDRSRGRLVMGVAAAATLAAVAFVLFGSERGRRAPGPSGTTELLVAPRVGLRRARAPEFA